MIAAAMSTLYSFTPVVEFTMLFKATVIGCVPACEKDTPNRKSFQICVNCQMTVTTMIGIESGRKTDQKIRKNPAPSIFAARISSGEMLT